MIVSMHECTPLISVFGQTMGLIGCLLRPSHTQTRLPLWFRSYAWLPIDYLRNAFRIESANALQVKERSHLRIEVVPKRLVLKQKKQTLEEISLDERIHASLPLGFFLVTLCPIVMGQKWCVIHLVTCRSKRSVRPLSPYLLILRL